MLKKENLFLQFAEKSQYVVPWLRSDFDRLKWLQVNDFDVGYGIPDLVWRQESVLKSIDQSFSIEGVYVLKLSPDRVYNWHVDTDRGVSINLLLNEKHESFCLFGSEVDGCPTQLDILKLEYQPETFYLFNTQSLHSVTNFKYDRFLLSVVFQDDRTKLSYSDIKKFVREQEIPTIE
jgi:hypothetical protein